MEHATPHAVRPAIVACLAGGGEMGALMRGQDWSATPVGPAEAWPQSLQTAVSICLNSRFPIILFWGEALTQFYNDAYRPILGATKHLAALGQRASECWPEIWDVVGPMLRGVLAAGDATWSENLLLIMERNAYLEEAYFTFSYSPIGDERGIGGVFCAVTETTTEVLGERRMSTLRDLSARAGEGKKAEAACQLATATLAVNDSDIPFALIYLLDLEGQRALLAGSAGLEPDSAASPALIEVERPDTANAQWPLEAVRRSGEPAVVADLLERFGPLPAGPWPEPVQSALILPLTSPAQDRLAGFLIAAVSPRRALDESYRSFYNLAAGEIAAAVANARAYDEERRRAEALAELDGAKTAFFSNVSHEFRTPLTLMLGPAADALADDVHLLPPPQRDRIEVVQRNALRLLKLVNTLLDFSRIEAGRARAVYEPTDLAAFTAGLAAVFRAAVERAGIRLEVDCPALPAPVSVDREMWEKIVLNLLSNALKFTFEGEIAVRLRWLGDHVELEVRDTGTGIAADELPHLFERFRRIRGVRARTQEGSGIGLALVQELVRLHGGTVQVASALGEGASFTIAIPTGTAHVSPDRLDRAPAPAAAGAGAIPYVEEALGWLPEPEGVAAAIDGSHLARVPETAVSSPLTPSDPGGVAPAHILLVDDNADMREYVRRLLSQRWSVEAAADGRAALERARAHTPDLVLSDVMMPGLDGFELLRELRADPVTRDVPVILLSARAGEESRVEGVEAGADDYLVKPFSARELVARVGARLELARMRRESERAVSTILESISDGFMAFDDSWRFTYINREAERFLKRLGKPASLLIGENIWEMFPEFRDTVLEPEYRRAMAEQVGTSFEVFFPPLDVWFEVRAYPSAAGLSVYFRDVTDRRRVETERERLLVSEQAARLQAEAASRAKDEFLSIVSHELRTPLTPLLGYTQILRSGRLDPPRTAQALEAIERSAKAQAQLVGDILDVSRIITGKLPLERALIDLPAVITAVLETIRLPVETKQIELVVTLDTAALPVMGDAGRLQQVVWNLLANAIKFTPLGGRVEVSLRREGANARIVVRDTGIGIASEFLPYIFERFSQANVSHTREHGGLGLGLAIVRHLVELHGGSVGATSPGPNAGASFHVTLPLAAASGRPAGPASLPAAPADTAEAGRLEGLRVLVVDDEPDTRDLLALILEQEGARVRAVSSAAEALAAFDQEPPGLLVSDVGMPAEDGYTLLRQVRARAPEKGGAVPAIALTAYAGDDDRRRALAAGYQEHLPKPLDADALVRLVATLAGRRP